MDWQAIWEREIKERKEKITEYIKSRMNDVKILGDYLQSAILELESEIIDENSYGSTLTYYYSDEYKAVNKFIEKLPEPNKEVKQICSNIIYDIFHNNMFHDYKVFNLNPLSVINIENREKQIHYNADPVLYIVGLFFQHNIQLELFYHISMSDVLENMEFPKKRSDFFAFFLITLQGMFNLIDPWWRTLIFFDYFNALEREEDMDIISEEAKVLVTCFLSRLWDNCVYLIIENEKSRIYWIINLLKNYEKTEIMEKYFTNLKKRYKDQIDYLLKNEQNIEKELEMKYWHIDEKKWELKKKIEKRVYDYRKTNVHKIKTLNTFDIPELTPDESRKYGKFKVEKKEFKGDLYGIPIEHDIVETVYREIEGEWVHVLTHTLYSWKKEIEHGKEYERKDVPLRKIMYVDIEDEVFYIETEDGCLYVSLNLRSWFDWYEEPEKRPYWNKINKLRKFKIPN